MENVILTQKEQARLQVLNSLLAEHMTLDQAAMLIGVTPDTPGAFWRLTGREEPPPSPMATGAARLPTQRPTRWWPMWFTWLALAARPRII